MRFAIAFFLVLHGTAHLVGFLTPWGYLPPSPPGTPAAESDALLGGRVVLSSETARGLGLLWLAAAIGFLVVAGGVWGQAPWARPALAMITVASLALSTAWWPAARIGVAIDVVLLLLLVLLGAGWLPAEWLGA